jgi:tRNA U34 5-methylaminomethyl-2-thiouridine-forming methyltransferase MnmC
VETGYKLVKVASGAHSVHSLAYRETFHPVIGPAAEADALYVRQTRLLDRLLQNEGEFVIWDVGLGAAANPLALLRAAQEASCQVRFVSFDQTVEPLRFALQHVRELDFLAGYELELEQLLQEREVSFRRGYQDVKWELHLADFPGLLNSKAAENLPKPHLVMFDAFSPATNPAMWTLPLFTRLFGLLDPNRACALPTYSRSTMLRVTLLLAEFFVGVGHATGEKEETTVASNKLEMVEEPLGPQWLKRVRRSTSAEPLRDAIYRQQKLTEETWEKLERHPQFR